jgi:hypothetical protein
MQCNDVVWKAIILALMLTLAAPAASATETPAPAAPAPSLEMPIGTLPAAPVSSWEVPIGTLQLTLGFLGTLVAFTPTIAVLGNGTMSTIPAAFVTLAPVPLVTGTIVCGLGRLSHQYGGGCGAPILGAYLGSLSGAPLAYLLCKSRQNQPGSGDEALGCIGGVFIGIVLGESIGGTIGSVIGWQLAKKPRAGGERLPGPPPPPAPSHAEDWPELRLRPASSTPPGTSVSVPLLAFAF